MQNGRQNGRHQEFQNFTNKSHKESYNTSFCSVFASRNSSGGICFVQGQGDPKKVFFKVKYDLKMKKGKIIVILNVFIKFICFSILVLCIIQSEARACTIANTESLTNKSPNTTRPVACTTLLALQYLKLISTLK